jgi:flagellar protein FliL
MSTAVVEAPTDESGRRRSRLVPLLALLVLLLGGGGAAWFFVLGPGGEPADGTVVDGEIVALEPLTTTTGASTLRHARVGLAVVLAEGVDPAVVKPKAPLLKDALLREVADMDADLLRSPEGSDRLRTQLTAEARDIWGNELVRRVVLTELLVQ